MITLSAVRRSIRCLPYFVNGETVMADGGRCLIVDGHRQPPVAIALVVTFCCSDHEAASPLGRAFARVKSWLIVK